MTVCTSWGHCPWQDAEDSSICTQPNTECEDAEEEVADEKNV